MTLLPLLIWGLTEHRHPRNGSKVPHYALHIYDVYLLVSLYLIINLPLFFFILLSLTCAIKLHFMYSFPFL